MRHPLLRITTHKDHNWKEVQLGKREEHCTQMSVETPLRRKAVCHHTALERLSVVGLTSSRLRSYWSWKQRGLFFFLFNDCVRSSQSPKFSLPVCCVKRLPHLSAPVETRDLVLDLDRVQIKGFKAEERGKVKSVLRTTCLNATLK